MEIYGLQAAAEYLGITRARVWQLVDSKRLPATRVSKYGQWFIRKSDLVAFKLPKNGWPKGKKRKKIAS